MYRNMQKIDTSSPQVTLLPCTSGTEFLQPCPEAIQRIPAAQPCPGINPSSIHAETAYCLGGILLISPGTPGVNLRRYGSTDCSLFFRRSLTYSDMKFKKIGGHRPSSPTLDPIFSGNLYRKYKERWRFFENFHFSFIQKNEYIVNCHCSI